MTLIRSTTGTGKTSAVAQHIKRYMKQHRHVKFITITTRQTLSQQHELSFEDISLASYQTNSNLSKFRAVTVCLNSLEKLQMDDDDMSNYVVFIDEVTSFTEFTHNDTLKRNVRQVYGIS